MKPGSPVKPQGPDPTLREVLLSAIDEMVSKGIYWPDALVEFEKLFILRTLREHHGNLSRTAHEMGIHRNTLGKKIRQHGITRSKHGGGG